MTITLSNGKWQGNTLKNDTEDVNTIYFTWPDIPTVTQNISEINDSNNTITWKTLDSATPKHIRIQILTIYIQRPDYQSSQTIHLSHLNIFHKKFDHKIQYRTSNNERNTLNTKVM